MGGCFSTPEAPVDPVQEDATGGLSEAYDVKHLLGSGSAGDTWLCQERSTGDLVAVKLIKRPIPPLMGTSIMREVKIGAELGKGHLNIVKPREVVLTRTHLGLVMEYVAGGNMADYILKSILLKFGQFDRRDGLVMDEDEALYFFKQVISAVEYCHEHKVAHRDLKMDNTLLDDNDPPRIKLCDFGFARNWMGQQPQMTTITGTPDYMSPQLLGAKIGAPCMQAQYDGTKVDIWAAGVMLCVMLIGRFPFEGTEMSHVTNLDDVSEHVWAQQTQATAPWHDNPLIAHDCGMLSPDCIDLLNRMFNLDESARITIAEIKAHPWFDRRLPPLYENALERLQYEQAAIDQQVASGAFVSRDRDSALKTMIYLAASRFNPEQEEGMTLGGAARPGDDRRPYSLLRKISLTTLMPGQYVDVAASHRTDLATISKFFHENEAVAQEEAAAAAAAAAGLNGGGAGAAAEAAIAAAVGAGEAAQQQQAVAAEAAAVAAAAPAGPAVAGLRHAAASAGAAESDRNSGGGGANGPAVAGLRHAAAAAAAPPPKRQTAAAATGTAAAAGYDYNI